MSDSSEAGLRNDVLHRHHQGETQRHIARQPGISRWKVSTIIDGYLQDRASTMPTAPDPPGLEQPPRKRGSKLDEFEPTYEIAFTQEGRRKVNAFSYVLAYSRRQYVSFTEKQDFETTLREHIQAFRHLGGPAAVCLYDNMKVVVTRWEDGQPIYNTRFLSFATHYGFKPWACQIRRPQTKGKVERPFHYIEGNLLNGRTFRSLEHLNEVARCWLSEIADRRLHGTTRKTPLELHAEELPHLLPLPTLEFDTSQVVYRNVESDGTIRYENNRYSVPWQLAGELLPVRITERSLIVYGRHLSPVAEHRLARGHAVEPILDPAHAPPKDHEEQMRRLRERFAELGETGLRFLEGLLSKQRCGKHQATQVLVLLHAYPKADVLAALARAITYHAYGFSSLERILALTSKPKAGWQQIGESEQEAILRLAQSEPIGPRHSREYQDLINRPTDHVPLSKDPCKEGVIDGKDSESAGNNRAGEASDQSSRADPKPSPDASGPTGPGTSGSGGSGGDREQPVVMGAIGAAVGNASGRTSPA